MITVKHKGNFNKIDKFFDNTLKISDPSILDKYGKIGVEELSRRTPVDTGKTASSWSYSVENGNRLVFYNSNVNKGIPIVILLQYGHASRNGTFVQGTDFINPALRPVFDDLSNMIRKEMAEL